MSKKVMIGLTTLLVTLLATSTLGGAYLVYAQEVDENQAAAENMLSQLNELESDVTSLFETTVGDGGEVPEDAEEALEEAQQLHAEAQGLYDEGSYEECVEKATEALNKYGKALTEATPEEPEEPETITTQVQEEVDEETEEMKGMFTAIEKAWDRIEKLEDVAAKLGEKGIDVTEASGVLGDAGEILTDITENTLPENPEEAEAQLAEAKSLIGQATGLLKSSGEPIKEEKIEHFRNQAIHHVEQLSAKMNRFMEKFGLPGGHSLAVQAQYGGIIAGLGGVDTKDGLKDAVTQLKLLEKETRNVGKDTGAGELLGGDTIESINEQVKLESKLMYYWGIVNGMEEDDPVKAEAGGLLAEAEGLLGGAEAALAEGDVDLAGEKVAEAEEILGNVDDLLDDYVKGNGKGQKPDKGTKEAKTNGNGHNKDDTPTDETVEGQEEPEDPENPEDQETTTT